MCDHCCENEFADFFNYQQIATVAQGCFSIQPKHSGLKGKSLKISTSSFTHPPSQLSVSTSPILGFFKKKMGISLIFEQEPSRTSQGGKKECPKFFSPIFWGWVNMFERSFTTAFFCLPGILVVFLFLLYKIVVKTPDFSSNRCFVVYFVRDGRLTQQKSSI